MPDQELLQGKVKQIVGSTLKDLPDQPGCVMGRDRVWGPPSLSPPLCLPPPPLCLEVQHPSPSLSPALCFPPSP